jgi:hypothetical protein
VDNDVERTLVLKALRGAPWTVVIAMLMFPNIHGEAQIAAKTGYTRKTVRGALGELETLGFVKREGRYQAWILTVHGRQMILGETDPQALEVEGESLPLPAMSCHGVGIATQAEHADKTPYTHMDEGENLPLTEGSLTEGSLTEGSLTEGSLAEGEPEGGTTGAENARQLHLALPDDLRPAWAKLVSLGCPPNIALQAVTDAMTYYFAEDLCAIIDDWLAYCRSSKGDGIKMPKFFIARRLQAGIDPPELPPPDRDERARAYLEAHQDQIIQH